jgi:hypothetical protein
MDCCIPEDIVKHIIFRFVDDLKLLDQKKQVLKIIAYEIQGTVVYDVIRRMDDLLDYISWTEDVVETGLYEMDFGPSSDYGDYYCVNLEMEIKRYRSEVEHWNTFVDDHEHLRPYIPNKQQEYFKKITLKW